MLFKIKHLTLNNKLYLHPFGCFVIDCNLNFILIANNIEIFKIHFLQLKYLKQHILKEQIFVMYILYNIDAAVYMIYLSNMKIRTLKIMKGDRVTNSKIKI